MSSYQHNRFLVQAYQNHTVSADESYATDDAQAPDTHTDHAIARWNGTTGGLLQDSGVIIDHLDNITGINSLTIADGVYCKTNLGVASYALGGANIGSAMTTADSNILFGNTSTGSGLISGQNNIFMGIECGNTCNSNSNTLIGCSNSTILTSGFNNTVIGNSTAASLTTGDNCTLIGNSSNCDATADNQTAIGYGATCTTANEVVIGNSSVTHIRPSSNGVCDLGLTGTRFKDLYLSGGVQAIGDSTFASLTCATVEIDVSSNISGVGTITTTNVDTDIIKGITDTLTLRDNAGGNQLVLNASGTTFSGAPVVGTGIDLGKTASRWKDLYLSGSIYYTPQILPPVMTADTQAYWTVAASSYLDVTGYEAYRLFNRVSAEGGWVSGSNFSSGIPTVNRTKGGVTQDMEWISVDYSRGLQTLVSFNLQERGDTSWDALPTSIEMRFSMNNGYSWDSCYTATGLTWSQSELKTFTLDEPVHFTNLVLCITQLGAAGGICILAELGINGY